MADRQKTARPKRGAPLAGSEEVVDWVFPSGYTTTRQSLAVALETEGFDPSEAGELTNAQAFGRAVKNLAEGNLVRLFGKDNGSVSFQLTGEWKGQDRLNYDFEGMYTLNKESGVVTGTSVVTADMIQAELLRLVEARSTADVNRMLQRLCESSVRLVQVKPNSGVYLALPCDAGFLSRLGRLVQRIGGTLRRWPVDHSNPVASATTAQLLAEVEATREEGDEMLPVAAQDDWPSKVLREQDELVKTALDDIKEAFRRLEGHQERLRQHRTWLVEMIAAADQREKTVPPL